MAHPSGVSGLGLLRRMLSDVSLFYRPWVPFSFFAFPVAINYYGIIKFNKKHFYENKPVADASKFGGPKAAAAAGGH